MILSALKAIGILAAMATLASATVIQGEYTTIEGKPANGTVVVQSLNAFTTASGVYVPAQRRSYTIKSGRLSISLQANTGSSPASFYVVSTSIDNGPSETTMWIVPVSASPVTVASVTSSSPQTVSQMISPQQISPAGATNGQVLTLVSGAYAPASPAPGGVTSVNGETGAVSLSAADVGAQPALGYTAENAANKNASNGYAPLDSSSKLPTANLPTTVPEANLPSAIPATKIADGSVTNAMYQYLSGATSNLQTQLNAKLGGSGTTNALPYWTSSTGMGAMDATYDSSIKSYTFNHSSGGYTQLSNRRSFFGSQIQDWSLKLASNADQGQLTFFDKSGNEAGNITWYDAYGIYINGLTSLSASGAIQGGFVQGGTISSVGTASVGSVKSSSYPSCFQSGGNATIQFDDLGLGTGEATSFEGICTLTANRTLVLNTKPHSFTVRICQNATGGWTLAWPAEIRGGMTISSAANSCSVQSFKSFGGSVWYATAAGVTGL
jgi:hypothetical protein